MRPVVYLSCFLLTLLTGAAEATPLEGRYNGVLRVTRGRLFGVPTVTSVRAVATVSASGNLSIILLGQPSAFPDAPQEGLQTVIAADGSCLIPRKPVTPSLAQTPPATGGDHLTISAPLMTPEFHGQVQVSGNMFSVSYDDVPDRYVDANGNTIIVNTAIAPIPSAEFTFTFRRAIP